MRSDDGDVVVVLTQAPSSSSLSQVAVGGFPLISPDDVTIHDLHGQAAPHLLHSLTLPPPHPTTLSLIHFLTFLRPCSFASSLLYLFDTFSFVYIFRLYNPFIFCFTSTLFCLFLPSPSHSPNSSLLHPLTSPLPPHSSTFSVVYIFRIHNSLPSVSLSHSFFPFSCLLTPPTLYSFSPSQLFHLSRLNPVSTLFHFSILPPSYSFTSSLIHLLRCPHSPPPHSSTSTLFSLQTPSLLPPPLFTTSSTSTCPTPHSCNLT